MEEIELRCIRNLLKVTHIKTNRAACTNARLFHPRLVWKLWMHPENSRKVSVRKLQI